MYLNTTVVNLLISRLEEFHEIALPYYSLLGYGPQYVGSPEYTTKLYSLVLLTNALGFFFIFHSLCILHVLHTVEDQQLLSYFFNPFFIFLFNKNI